MAGERSERGGLFHISIRRASDDMLDVVVVLFLLNYFNLNGR